MKKGSFIITTETFLWVARLIFLIVVAFSIFFIVSSHARREIDITDIEVETLITRLFYSPNCFVYADDVRKYPGVIDLKKFIGGVLEKCLNRTDFSAKLILNDLEKNELSKIFINKEEFEYDEHFCKFEKYNCIEKERYVLIYDDGNLKEGILEIIMVIK